MEENLGVKLIEMNLAAVSLKLRKSIDTFLLTIPIYNIVCWFKTNQVWETIVFPFRQINCLTSE